MPGRYPLVLLAGGGSRRMGQPKGLLPFRGQTWLDAQLAGFARAGGREAVVVAGAPYFRALDWLAHETVRCGLSVRAIEQTDPDSAPFDSLLLGLAAVKNGAFVFPIDVPSCRAVWIALADALGEADAAVPTYEGRRGHPVLLAPGFVARLSSMDERRLDRALAAAVRREVAVEEPVVLLDLNTPEQWSAWVESADAERCYPRSP